MAVTALAQPESRWPGDRTPRLLFPLANQKANQTRCNRTDDASRPFLVVRRAGSEHVDATSENNCGHGKCEEEQTDGHRPFQGRVSGFLVAPGSSIFGRLVTDRQLLLVIFADNLPEIDLRLGHQMPTISVTRRLS